MEAQEVDSDAAQKALAQLCEAYWYPLYAYVRRRGRDVPEAQDLVQEFFARVIQKNYIGAASRERGRFRTFLLSSLEHFLAKEWTRERRLKRGGGQSIISLELENAEGLREIEPSDDLTPEKLYDRRWAFAVLQEAMSKLQQEYATSGREALFDALAAVLSGDRPEFSYTEIGSKLGMSEGAVKVAVHRLRQRYGELVRSGIADTVTKPEMVDEEIRALFASFA